MNNLLIKINAFRIHGNTNQKQQISRNHYCSKFHLDGDAATVTYNIANLCAY